MAAQQGRAGGPDACQSGGTRLDDISRLADWAAARGRVIAIVGAGGKSTLLYALAQEMAARGRSGIVTTTTHIWRPDALPLAEDPQTLRRLTRRHPLVVCGKARGDGRLSPPGPAPEEMRSLADFIWVEADGSRGLPCKAPADFEPCIPDDAQVVLGVAGLTALNGRIADVCCRPERVQTLLEKPGTARITEEDIARILASPEGARKSTDGRYYAAVLNQCDSPRLMERAGRIRQLLADAGVDDVFLTARPSERSFSFDRTD